MTDEEPILWIRPEVTGHGKTPAYSREQISKAAVAVADAEGIEAVSMRRVASEIGAGTMSLYRYVRNKDELYALMVDWVCGIAQTPDKPGHTLTEHLRGYGRGVRALVLAHPWFPALQAEIPAPTPNMFRGMEYMMAALDGPGRAVDEMLEMVTTVMTFSSGFAQNELAEASATLASGVDQHERMLEQGPYVWSLVASGEFPYLRRILVEAAGPHDDAETNFERALDRIVTGLAATFGQSAEG